MNALYQIQKKTGERAQAIVEFAIVLPILMMLLVGILEVGRMVYTYAVVTNASRDAARYASAWGLADDGLHNKYNYCVGIEAAARRFAYFIPTMTIDISYDDGNGNLLNPDCVDDGSGADSGVTVSSDDRVVVTVTATYSPLVKLIPINPQTITSSSARTILGVVKLSP